MQITTASANFSLTWPLCCTVSAFNAAFEIEYVAHRLGLIVSEKVIDASPDVILTILAALDSSSASSRNCVVLAGPITLMRMFSLRSDSLMESEV
jgi:hypothetical protein